MSSLIDDLIFKNSNNPHTNAKDRQKQQILYELSQRVHFNDESAIITMNNAASASYNRIQLQNQSCLVKLSIESVTSSLKVGVVMLPSWMYQKISSKQQQLAMIRSLANRQLQIPAETTLYIQNSRITMVITNCYLFTENVKISKLVEFYQHLIIKNILNFQNIVNKYLKNQNKNYRQLHREMEGVSELQQKLHLTQIIDTAHSIIDFSQEKMQFTFARETLNKQKQDFKDIQKKVVDCQELEQINRSLFKYYPVQFTATWVKNNFRTCYQKEEKKMKSLLKLKNNTKEKSIEEYIYNMVKIQIKEINQKPIGVGGFSLIYAAKASLSFISSADHSTYERTQPTVQRMIVLKKIKGEDKKQKQKLQHQKTIISKLRGSCSYFIPKYYATEKTSQLNQFLFMQLIQGEELDHYIASNSQTMSIYPKLIILLNIIHGMRHLNIYNIVHLDLKPINILVCKFQLIKIIDYGQAYHKDICKKNYVPGFTFPYCSPQIYIRFLKMSFQKGEEQFNYCQKQDVFSFGMIMFQVLFNTRIFSFTPSKYKEIYVKRQILRRMYFAAEKIIDCGDWIIYSTLMQIIIKCIDPNPQRRPRFDWIGIALKVIINFYDHSF